MTDETRAALATALRDLLHRLKANMNESGCGDTIRLAFSLESALIDILAALAPSEPEGKTS
jgi:hypothetical protein